MSDKMIVAPSKPRIISEEEYKGVYEIDGLYPGYGHTLGNSLRRIILSSLEGSAITAIKIEGAQHEFSVLDGVKEDVITIMLNLKKVRMKFSAPGPHALTLKVKGPKEVTAADIEIPGQVEITNPETVICHIVDKTEINIEMTAETGLGYLSKEALEKNRVDIGSIVLDAIFTPIRRVNYEVENMRVGDRTDFNRLRLFVETDGTITPRFALEESIAIMINQLKAIVGFKEDPLPAVVEDVTSEVAENISDEEAEEGDDDKQDVLKTRIENLDLSARTLNALSAANIRTIGGLARKKEKDILAIDGLGSKGLEEIKDILASMELSLKEE